MRSGNQTLLRAVLLATAIGCSRAVAVGEATHLGAEEEQALSYPTSFAEVLRVQDVPERVWTAFAQVTTDRSSQMADPGGNWQATDVISESGLPPRRLIFAGLSDRYCVLHFERGGRGHSYHLALFRLTGESAQLVWSAAIGGPLRDIAKVPDALRSPGLQDDPRFFF